MNIPIVFWLVLSSWNHGMVVLPVPFSSSLDCDTAGRQYLDQTKFYPTFACLQQRTADVYDFTSRSELYTTPRQFMDGRVEE